jgi:hypothetical protein
MWARRIARRMGWTRNPLRRTSDRLQAWLTLPLIVAMLLIGPWAGRWAAGAMYRDGIRANAWERQHRFPVTAVLLRDTSGWVNATGNGVAAPPSMPARARWTGPDGAVHIGTVYADAGARRGSTMAIWVDDHGAVAAPPVRRSATTDAVIAALLAVCGLAAGLCGVRRIVVWQLDRRRLRSWQAEWLVVGPRWSHR